MVDPAAIFPEMAMAEVMAKPNFGICISGGGNLSTTAGLGELRGLHHLGILQRARYSGTVSGGGSAMAAYAYQQRVDDRTFLGSYRDPDELCWDDFTRDDPDEFTSALARAELSPIFTPGLSDERFGEVLGRIYLEPFGLGNRRSFTAYGQRTVDDILRRNPHLDPCDFLVVPVSKPYHVMHSVLIRSRPRQGDIEGRYLPFEMTPNYSGVRPYFPRKYFYDDPVGGGYVESFAYDSELVEVLDRAEVGDGSGPAWTRVVVERSREMGEASTQFFSLSDMLAATGAIHSLVLAGLTDVVGPEFLHWSPETLEQGAREHRHIDGAGLDNTGLLGLLAREVKDIVVFINRVPYDPCDKARVDQIVRLMRGGHKASTREKAELVHVLDNESGRKIRDLMDGLDRRFCERRPLVHYDSYEVLRNDRLGIRGGYRVNIAWFVLGPTHEVQRALDDPTVESGMVWFDQLRPEVKAAIRHRPEQFRRFPNFRLAFENPPRGINLDIEQVNALAHYTAWCVVSEEDNLRAHFDGVRGLWDGLPE